MNTFIKVIAIGTALALSACAQQASAPVSADAYFFLWAAHTTNSEIPADHQTGLLSPPQVFQTEADCNKALTEATTETKTDEAKKWLDEHKIDKLKAVCVPVKF